jgi:hypothetical protein
MGPSDEEKKAAIINYNRSFCATWCPQAGTQDPQLFVHPNPDGTGSMTEVWESEAAVVKTLYLAYTGGTAASVSGLTYEQQKRFVLDDLVKSYQEAGARVTYTITDEGDGPGTGKVVLTFPTYRQLLDFLYEQAAQDQQAQLQPQKQWAAGQDQESILRMMELTSACLQCCGCCGSGDD